MRRVRGDIAPHGGARVAWRSSHPSRSTAPKSILFHLRRLMRSWPRAGRAGVRRQPDGAGDAGGLSRRHRRRQSRAAAGDAAAARIRSTAATLHEARTLEESKAINELGGPLIIISASGMATGGRVLHHLLHAPAGRAQRGHPARLPGRGHARPLAARRRRHDQDARPLRAGARGGRAGAGLLGARRSVASCWAGCALRPSPPEIVYIVHGEPAASAALQRAIHDQLGWTAVAPRYQEAVRLD